MRIVTVRVDGAERWGVLDDNNRVRLGVGSLIDALGDDGALPAPTDETVALDTVTLLAPIPEPRRNVMCLGLNYADHAAEASRASGKETRLPEHPVVFTKATTAVTGPGSEILLEPDVTEQLDWEAELAFVIGRGGRHIQREHALDHVFGYTIVNDLSARDIQFRHKQFFLGKSLEGACPMGPWITTADAIADPQTLDIRCRVNGELKQHSNTSNMLFGVAEIIAVLSGIMRLLPGDVIATGTPDGVGFARNPPEYLRAGDEVECEIAGLGVLRNRFV
ncbi:2-keto-4-pentenoate hydratase/2-oxohepta-3-ene-1,7-dioic acid hydratase in catechol pathway [Natronocella acetinitrilica]|uniref:2-keto-4-pentenoate hydratase/2-oxohepta-3-ene-1,7-dioic acid hydratase in catechol pathway n=1 Tax=Natronocella acetinitrilica TaxID=414046 RepID=A0AAE3KBY7_9GAMM|nr:fumarylacetoacetate hydrolase family protein [Natronocella acetinitrilica]MCP1675141.1 2-keto-4-pentenoate hydratase/2-oxohepta-3-ene-1,7-dioic acid hydratase in catechol pathway [Natronocella acetinitrilica]